MVRPENGEASRSYADDGYCGSKRADVHLGHGTSHETAYVDADYSEHLKIPLANGASHTFLEVPSWRSAVMPQPV